MEILVYVLLSAVLFFRIRVLDAIKSGCFYAAKKGIVPEPLAKYINNLHFLQTPIWYCIFFGYGLLLLSVFRLRNPDHVFSNIAATYLIVQGVSAMAGYQYQKYINIGSGLPAIDPNEKRSMEIAIPYTTKSVWVPRFWYGVRRYYISWLSIILVAAGIYLGLFYK